jgi:pyruvate oxidase/acetolactate synthase-1/2/3 large subunit
MIYICKVCGYEYDESKEATSFADLPDSWVCPVCGVGKDMFEAGDEPSAQQESDTQESENLSEVLAQTLSNWGVKYVFGMVGHSNLGTADAIRKQFKKATWNLSEFATKALVHLRHQRMES